MEVKSIRRKHTPGFKKQVVLELLKEAETVSQICSRYSIHPSQANRWKSQALEGLGDVFSKGVEHELREKDQLIEELYKQVGQLKVELDWLKKKLGYLSG